MELITLKGINLNTPVYRGFASIRDLAAISAPDTYDTDKNPEGLQRDLAESHAADGYWFAKDAQKAPEYPRLWPEVILNVRDTSILEILPLNESPGFFKLVIHEDKINRLAPRPQISRTDGNHRLYYGMGFPKKNWLPLAIPTPFCLTIGLTVEQEASLFKDINESQKRMNTSHLRHLEARLTPSEVLAIKDPDLWIANKLVEDNESPFHGIVYLGGAPLKDQGLKRRVNLAALRTSVQMIRKESRWLEKLPEFFGRYIVIRTYWSAVAKTYAQEWADSKKYLLLRGFGIWSMSILGADIIDRCMTRPISVNQYGDEMVAYLNQTRIDVDWDEETGNVRHYGGRLGARELAVKMGSSLSDEGVSIGSIARDLKSLY